MALTQLDLYRARDRLTAPQVRLADGTLRKVTWEAIERIMATLVVEAAGLEAQRGGRIAVRRPEGLGVKLFYEYQYLENTYTATKLFFDAPNVAFHDRPSVAGSSPSCEDAGIDPHDFTYEDVQAADVVLVIGTNPYEHQSVFFMQYCQGKRLVVVDPRRTATVDYALRTGGLHLRPRRLGTDPLLLYALARASIERWTRPKEQGGLGLGRFEPRLPVGDQVKIDELRAAAQSGDQKRRASRVMTYEQFRLSLEAGPYTLADAAQTGIPEADLETALRALIDPLGGAGEPPKVAILDEKGLIWGFNYDNTAAVVSLGLLLGSHSEPGRLTGRVGGHQKGWAERALPLEFLDHRDEAGAPRAKAKRYPFQDATGRYTDAKLAGAFPGEPWIAVRHNLDNHVFGPPEGAVPDPDRPGFVRLANGLSTRTCACYGSWQQLPGPGQRCGDETRPARGAVAAGRTGPRACEQRARGGDRGVPRAHAGRRHRPRPPGDVPEPHHRAVRHRHPRRGWGENDFIRYKAQRRLKLFARFQDMPLDPEEGGVPRAADPYAHLDGYRYSPKPDWKIFARIATSIGRELDDRDGGPLAGVLADAFGWRHAGAVADEMAVESHRGIAGESNGPHEREDHQRGERRPNARHHDVPQQLQGVAAVDRAGVQKGARRIEHEVSGQDRAEWPWGGRSRSCSACTDRSAPGPRLRHSLQARAWQAIRAGRVPARHWS